MVSPAIVEKLQSAVQHHQAGEITRAAMLYDEVLRADPDNADAWHLQGLVDVATGDIERGAARLRHATQLKPTELAFQANLAAVLVNHRQAVEAERLCREILAVDSRHVAALTHLATALRQQRRLAESLQAFQTVVDLQPTAVALCNAGSVLTDLGRHVEARQCFEDAIQQQPTLPQVHLNLAALLRESGQVEEALAELAIAERLQPESAEVHTNRGNLLAERGDYVAALQCYQGAISLDSQSASAVSGMGRALQQLGAWKESLEAHRLAAELEPHNASFASSWLYAATLNPELTPIEVAERHVGWGNTFQNQVPAFTHVAANATRRPLRVGYVSPDFRSHATMRFLYPLVKAHDRSAFRFWFYSETTQEDSTTETLRRMGDTWCRTRELSDEQLSEKILADGIDILVDLAGHTAQNRLPVFARKPAPIQASFLGYPATTGLSRIDYLLTDAVREPGDSAECFAERLVRLPHGACCFEALEAPDVVDPPCVRNGFVTLGATHRIEKISPAALDVWAAVMRALPTAKLLLFRDVFRNESLRNHTRHRLSVAGVDANRVDFGWELPKPHLQIYHNFDVLLDVFPWGSGTVAYDAMWMGVPIPTIAGDRGGCRATASLLHHAGFAHLVANSIAEYVPIVVRLASNQERLTQLRHEIRPAMKNSVANGIQFARDIEEAYRAFWDLHTGAAVPGERAVTR